MPGQRKSAEERREEILEVAVRHFAIGGLHGTSTEAIAREAGISQPYLFRLFHTKKELFVACVDRANVRVRDAFRRAAHSLKSNANTFGALGLGALARELELNGVPEDGADGALAALAAEYARAAARLKELRGG